MNKKNLRTRRARGALQIFGM